MVENTFYKYKFTERTMSNGVVGADLFLRGRNHMYYNCLCHSCDRRFFLATEHTVVLMGVTPCRADTSRLSNYVTIAYVF